MVPSTQTTTAIKLKMPQFIAAARGESDLPVHIAQACAELAQSIAAVATSSMEKIFLGDILQVADVLKFFQAISLVDDQGDCGKHGTNPGHEIPNTRVVLKI